MIVIVPGLVCSPDFNISCEFNHRTRLHEIFLFKGEKLDKTKAVDVAMEFGTLDQELLDVMVDRYNLVF